MKNIITLIILAFIAMIVPAEAFAGTMAKIKNLFGGEVLALIFSAALTIAGGTSAFLFGKIVKTFRETGEFLSVLGEAIEDKRLSRDELARIVKEGRDLFMVWK